MEKRFRARFLSSLLEFGRVVGMNYPVTSRVINSYESEDAQSKI